MPLDFTVLGDDGSPEKFVPIGVDAHQAFLAAARDAALPLLSRISDYYTDVTFDVGEVRHLLGEVQQLESRDQYSDAVRSHANSLKQLCEWAIAQGKPVEVIAD